MKHFPLNPLAMLALAMLAAGPARADLVTANLNSFNPGQIEVKSNGSAYTTTVIPLVSLNANITVVANAGASGKVKSWSAWLAARLGDGAATQFSGDKVSHSYALLDRPKSVNTRAHLSVPFGTIGTYAVAQCNALAGRLRSQGLSDEAIFGQDRSLKPGLVAMASAEFSGVAGSPVPPESVPSPPQLHIVCKGHAKPDKPGTTAGGGAPAGVGPALLKQVTMVVQHPASPTPVQCPVEVTAFMTFTAQGTAADGKAVPPGHFSYRVRSLSGKVSKTDLVVLQESDRNGVNFTKTLTQKFMVGVPGAAPAPAAPHGTVGPLGQQGPGGFASGTGKHATGPGAGAPGSYAAGGAPTDPNVHKDSLWIDIEGAKAGSVGKSDYFAYSVTCQPAPAMGGGPAGFQSRPNTSNPDNLPPPPAPASRGPVGEGGGAMPGAGSQALPVRPAGVGGGAPNQLAPATRRPNPAQ